MNNVMTEVDVLGATLAQIVLLTKKAETIKDALKDAATLPGGEKVYEGATFKATVISSDVKLVDYKKMLADLGVSAETVEKYTTTSARFSVKTTSR